MQTTDVDRGGSGWIKGPIRGVQDKRPEQRDWNLQQQMVERES